MWRDASGDARAHRSLSNSIGVEHTHTRRYQMLRQLFSFPSGVGVRWVGSRSSTKVYAFASGLSVIKEYDGCDNADGLVQRRRYVHAKPQGNELAMGEDAHWLPSLGEIADSFAQEFFNAVFTLNESMQYKTWSDLLDVQIHKQDGNAKVVVRIFSQRWLVRSRWFYRDGEGLQYKFDWSPRSISQHELGWKQREGDGQAFRDEVARITGGMHVEATVIKSFIEKIVVEMSADLFDDIEEIAF